MTDSITTFDEAYSAVADVEGWMTEGQAHLLWDEASALTAPATVVEIGSYQGRSAIVLGKAADDGVDVVAIDPHAGNDRGPYEIKARPDEGEADHQRFIANLDAAGLQERVRHVRKPSADALGDVDGRIDLLYIDGAHRYAPARDDVRDWGARVADGGTMLIHDSFSSIGVTLALMRVLFFSSCYRYLGRSTSMAVYRRERLDGRDRIRNAARQAAELPWFIRNLLVKLLLAARLDSVVRLLGHRQATVPY